MSSFRIPFWPGKLSDEQYVERTRKGLKLMRRARYFNAAVGLGMLIFVFWLSVHAIDFLSDANNSFRDSKHGPPPLKQEEIYTMYFTSCFFGFLAGYLFFQAVFHIGSALFEYRKDKLLVECWDALSDAEKTRLRQKSS